VKPITKQRTTQQRTTQQHNMMKNVCCVGVCKDMTWDEAKEFIIYKHNLLFWESWVNRVSWRDFTEIEKKLMTENNKLKEEKDTIEQAYTKTLKRRNWDASERKKLKEHIKDIDAVEEQLLEILQEGDVKDKFGDTYEELTYEMVPELLKAIVEENKKLKEQYQPKGSRIDAEGLHDFMNEKIEELKEENKKLKEEIKYSTLLTGETIQSVFQDKNPILADADKFCEKVAEEYREGVSQYLYDKMCETIADDIDIEEEIWDMDNFSLLDINHKDHPCQQDPEIMKEYQESQ
jgi:hypothetical protein